MGHDRRRRYASPQSASISPSFLSLFLSFSRFCICTIADSVHSVSPLCYLPKQAIQRLDSVRSPMEGSATATETTPCIGRSQRTPLPDSTESSTWAHTTTTRCCQRARWSSTTAQAPSSPSWLHRRASSDFAPATTASITVASSRGIAATA